MYGDPHPPDDVRDVVHEMTNRWRTWWATWTSTSPTEWSAPVRWFSAAVAWLAGLTLTWSLWWLVGLPVRAALQKDLGIEQAILARTDEAAQRLPALTASLRSAQADDVAWRRLLPIVDGASEAAIAVAGASHLPEASGGLQAEGPRGESQNVWRADLERLVARAGLMLETTRPGPSAASEGVSRTDDLEIERAEMRVRGTVADLLGWLADIDRMPRHLAIERFSLQGPAQGTAGTVDSQAVLTVTIAAYLWRKPANLASPAATPMLPAMPALLPAWDLPADMIDVFRTPLTRRPAQDAVTMAASGQRQPTDETKPVGSMRAGSRHVVFRRGVAGLEATWREDPPSQGRRTKPGGVDTVDVTLQGVQTGDVLRTFAQLTGRSVVIGESVEGSLDMDVRGVSAATAFDVMIRSAGLGVRSIDGVDWIAPRAQLLADEQTQLEAAAKREAMLPLTSRRFTLNYPRALALREIIMGEKDAKGRRLLSARGSLIADPRTNQLFVTDLPEKLEALASFIARVDVPVRQVLIEARIVEADDRFSDSLGVRLAGYSGAPGGGREGETSDRGGRGRSGDARGTDKPEGKRGDDGKPRGSSLDIGLPAAALAGVVPPSLAITLFGRSATRFLQIELSALETSGRGRVISRPRVVTADKIQAVIEQGTELPYQTREGRRSVSSVHFRKATLRLEVTPLITPDGRVILDVDVRKDSVGQEVVGGFAIDTRQVKTQVQVENGGTVAIGGIYQEEQRDSRARVPWLGDVPVLGALFRNRAEENRRTELLVFLTPSVVPEGGGSSGDASMAVETPSDLPAVPESGPSPALPATVASAVRVAPPASKSDLPVGHPRLTEGMPEATRSARQWDIPVSSGIGTQISAVYAGKRNTCRTDGGGQDHGWTRSGTTSRAAVL
jgi:type IV pilus assembly protein PilQ